jgi:hypothetical protein
MLLKDALAQSPDHKAMRAGWTSGVTLLAIENAIIDSYTYGEWLEVFGHEKPDVDLKMAIDDLWSPA